MNKERISETNLRNSIYAISPENEKEFLDIMFRCTYGNITDFNCFDLYDKTRYEHLNHQTQIGNIIGDLG